jgi:hypothetical protein
MIKLHTNAKLLPSKSVAYNSYKKTFVRSLSVHLFIISVLITTALVVKNYYDSVINTQSNIQHTYNEVLSKHIKTIKDNSSIDKALSDFSVIKVADQRPTRTSLVSEFSEMLSYISYYYGVSNKIDVKISVPLNITPNIARLKVSLSFNSSGDSQTVPIVDSILMNTKGFMFVENIDIKKTKNTATSSIDLYWYTSTKIKVSAKDGTRFYIAPKKYPHTIEDKYRISLWNGEMIP